MPHTHTSRRISPGPAIAAPGRAHYRAYDRAHEVRLADKPTLICSSDPHSSAIRHAQPRGAARRVAVVVPHAVVSASRGRYGNRRRRLPDDATGTMDETRDGGGHFTEVTLHPVTTHGGRRATAARLHERAHALCYVASSVAFPSAASPDWSRRRNHHGLAASGRCVNRSSIVRSPATRAMAGLALGLSPAA